MKVTQLFREKLAPDEIKSRLCLKIGISRSTLDRWLARDNDKLGHLRVIEAVSELTGLTQEEMFEKEELEVLK